ncbi:uncharacterized protein LOC142355699 [Convolutriloba macropyga]|uniref:uncharacterized protein LOC142355699 n=1 Tax=Convolutriloba macropyga TaxID=536237 RepID=UPI003F52469B
MKEQRSNCRSSSSTASSSSMQQQTTSFTRRESRHQSIYSTETCSNKSIALSEHAPETTTINKTLPSHVASETLTSATITQSSPDDAPENVEQNSAERPTNVTETLIPQSSVYTIANNKESSRNPRCSSFLSKDTFLQRYATSLAVTMFICYSPFFNWKLISTLDGLYFGSGQGYFHSESVKWFLPYISSVTFFTLNLNAVFNPIIFILLKHRSKNWKKNKMDSAAIEMRGKLSSISFDHTRTLTMSSHNLTTVHGSIYVSTNPQNNSVNADLPHYETSQRTIV